MWNAPCVNDAVLHAYNPLMPECQPAREDPHSYVISSEDLVGPFIITTPRLCLVRLSVFLRVLAVGLPPCVAGGRLLMHDVD